MAEWADDEPAVPQPRRLVTEKLGSYKAAHRATMPSVIHSARQYENNRAEVSEHRTH